MIQVTQVGMSVVMPKRMNTCRLGGSNVASSVSCRQTHMYMSAARTAANTCVASVSVSSSNPLHASACVGMAKASKRTVFCRSESPESASASASSIGVESKPAESSSSKAAEPAQVEVTEDTKSLEIMRKFSVQYAKRTNTYFCSDKGVTAVVIQGLAEHKDQLGAPLCPCRHYEDKEAEVAQGFWNCPCVPMRERRECHCMLFLTEDNPFTEKEADISLDELIDLTKDAKG